MDRFLVKIALVFFFVKNYFIFFVLQIEIRSLPKLMLIKPLKKYFMMKNLFFFYPADPQSWYLSNK